MNALAILRDRNGRVPGHHAALRAPTTYSDGSVSVDPDKGIIHNVALITVGPARGHPFDIDQTTVEQLAVFVNGSADGIKSRFRHPEVTDALDAGGNVIGQQIGDDTGTMVGRVRNARVVGDQARGDIYLGDYADSLPGLGDVRSYLLGLAQEDPAGIGMSAFFPYEIAPALDALGNVIGRPARLLALDAIDFVSVAAANPHGLLSAIAGTFDPQPPTPNAGWVDPMPRYPMPAPIMPTPDDDEDGDADDLLTEMSDWNDDALGLLCNVSGLDDDDIGLSDDDQVGVMGRLFDQATIMGRLSPRQISIVRAAAAGARSFGEAAQKIRRSRRGPGMLRSTADRRRLSIHEAGHAVMCATVGIQGANAQIDDHGGQVTHNVLHINSAADARRAALVLWAGAAAETLLISPQVAALCSDTHRSEGSDGAQLLHLAHCHGGRDPVAWSLAAKHRALSILAARMPALKKIAGMLRRGESGELFLPEDPAAYSAFGRGTRRTSAAKHR